MVICDLNNYLYEVYEVYENKKSFGRIKWETF